MNIPEEQPIWQGLPNHLLHANTKICRGLKIHYFIITDRIYKTYKLILIINDFSVHLP